MFIDGDNLISCSMDDTVIFSSITDKTCRLPSLYKTLRYSLHKYATHLQTQYKDALAAKRCSVIIRWPIYLCCLHEPRYNIEYSTSRN